MVLTNIEFYNTPEGDIMIKEPGKAVRIFSETDRDIVTELLRYIREVYKPATFEKLAEKYSRYEKNHVHYEFLMAAGFIRCNFGEYDHNHIDIDSNGSFNLEEVKCPLRGECQYEGDICKPSINTLLTERELEVLEYISIGKQSQDIADILHLSILTVKRHKQNIKAKLHLHTIVDLANYYNKHLKQ